MAAQLISDAEMDALFSTDMALTRSYTDDEDLKLLVRDDTEGIGVFFRCHGLLHKHIERRIPPQLKIMKKNISECGTSSPFTTRYRLPTETPEVIVEQLTSSFAPAFTQERCRTTPWVGRDPSNPGIIKGVVEGTKTPESVHIDSLTCEEFNTNSENFTTHFILKIYMVTGPTHRALFSFGGVTIDLFTVSGIEEILARFNILQIDPSHPNYEKIKKVVDYINSNIEFREKSRAVGIPTITTDFIFNLSLLLHFMYGVVAVRILDESCNGGRTGLKDIGGVVVGFGGKRKSRRKHKRKSKKVGQMYN